MAKFNQLTDLIADAEGDFNKFYDKNNKAAGTRIRKTMQALKVLAQEIRTEVQSKKNA